MADDMIRKHPPSAPCPDAQHNFAPLDVATKTVLYCSKCGTTVMIEEHVLMLRKKIREESRG